MVPTAIPSGHGLLPKLLENPGRELHHLTRRLLTALDQPTLWVLAAMVLLTATTLIALRGLRQRQLCQGGRLIRLQAPPQVDPAGAVTFWNNLIALLRPGWKRTLFGQPHLAFEIVADAAGLDVRIWVPDAVPPGLVESAVEAAWPGARTTTTPATAPIPAGAAATGGRLRLARPAAYPLATDHPADPLRPLLGALSGLGEDQTAAVQLLTRPVTGRRLRRLRSAATRRRAAGQNAPGRPAAATADPFRASELAGMVTKAASPAYATELHYTVATLTPAPDRAGAKRQAAARRGAAHAVASAFAGYTGLNRLTRRPLPRPVPALAGRRLGRGQLMSVAEVAALAHLPLDATVPGLPRAGARAVGAAPAVPTLAGHPGDLTDSSSVAAGRLTTDGNADKAGTAGTVPVPPVTDGKLLGLTERGRRVMMPVADSRQHLHVMGATGAGKSTLLTNLILDDIAAGRGVAVIDPKGDLITDLLDRMPETAADRIALLDPDSRAIGGPATVALNPLAGPDPQLAVDQLVGIFRRIYAGFWGPRTDDVLRSGALTLLADADRTRRPSSLADLPQLLTDTKYRSLITAELNDPGGLGGFWAAYEQLGDAGRSQMIGPLLNKLRAFLLRDFVRTTITSTTKTSTAVTNADADADASPAARVLAGGILLARLPKGLLGDDTSRLLGSFVVAQIWQAATHQAQLGQTDRPDASLYVDECHNFLTLPRSFDEVLAEARGYRLSLILAHQHLEQLPTELRSAISANARNKLLFAVSPEDAHRLERHTLPELSAHDLSRLSAYTAAARLVIAGNNTPAFTLRTRPAPPPIDGRADLLRTAIAAQRKACADGRSPVRISGQPPAADSSGPDTPRVRSRIRPGIQSGIRPGIRLTSDPPADGEAAAQPPYSPVEDEADLTGDWS